MSQGSVSQQFSKLTTRVVLMNVGRPQVDMMRRLRQDLAQRLPHLEPLLACSRSCRSGTFKLEVFPTTRTDTPRVQATRARHAVVNTR